jgi:hypothetical protein
MMWLTLWLPDDLHRRLRAASQRSDVSMNETAITLLSDALGHRQADDGDGSPLAEQVRHIRAALGDLALPANAFAEGPADETALERLDRPRLNPPLSQTISEEREDRF